MKNTKKIQKSTSKIKRETAYLTKRDIVRLATAAVKKASNQAMQTVGYVIKAEDGWVVRENKDGSISKIKQIKGASSTSTLVLD